MRNLWILTRFLLKSGPGKSNQKSGKKKAFSDGGRIVVYLLLGVCLLPVSVLLFLLGYSGYTFLQPLGLETLLIEFVCAIGMMVIFFYGLPLFLSEYYMDSDLVKLLPLPFTPAQIVGAKGFCCLLNEYYLIVLLFFPFLLGYGISAQNGHFLLDQYDPRLPYFPGCAARLRRSFDDARDASFQKYPKQGFLKLPRIRRIPDFCDRHQRIFAQYRKF